MHDTVLPGPDDIGYEWRREMLLDDAPQPDAMFDQHGRVIRIGAEGGQVTIFMAAGRCSLPPGLAEEFARRYARACQLAAGQAATRAQRAELKAAADEMRLARCCGTAPRQDTP